jgi:hypothetical protein
MARIFDTPNAVELAPARVTISNRTGNVHRNQDVFIIDSLELSFDNRLLRQIFDGAVHFFSDANTHHRNKRSTSDASCLAKLGLNATVQDKDLEATFHYTMDEIRSLLQFLYCAIDLTIGDKEITFELKMAVLDLREAITPQIDDSEAIDLRAKAVHAEINRQAGSRYVEDIF